MTEGPPAADGVPVRRRLFATWSLLVWIAWLFSRELLDCRHLPVALGRLLVPPWPAAEAAARAALGALAGAGITALAGLGAGRALLAIAAPGRGRLLAFAAGLPLLALAGQGLGWLGLADPRVFSALVAAAAAAALPGLGPPPARPPDTPRLLLWIPRVAAAAVFVAAFAPEVAWDAVVYHLRVPSLYLAAHRIVPIPAIFPSFFPFTGETLFLIARSLGGDPAARVLHAVVWLAAAEGVARLAALVWGRDAAAWGYAMFVTLPFGMVIASRAYVEFFLVLSLTGSLLALRAGREAWIAAGWLAGAAFGTKYLGGATALVLFGYAVYRAGGLRRPGPWVFAAAATAAGCAWLVRNWLWTGNPVYPVLFGGPRWTPEDMAGWRDDASALRPDLGLLLAAPWRLMIEPGSDGALSPLVLAAVAGPLLWPAARRGRLWGVALALFLVWWITAPLARYLTPALAVACAAGAGCVNGGPFAPRTRRWMTRLSLVGLAGSLLCGIKAIEFSTASYDAALGKQTPAAYRAGYFRPEGYDDVIAALEARVPRLGRAYMLGHLFSYDLSRRVWFEFLYVRPPLYWWIRDAGTSGRIMVRARQEGLTQIAWHPLGGIAILGRKPWLSDWTPAKLRAYRGFWDRHVRVAERIADWVIFDIAARSVGGATPAGGTPYRGRTLPGTEAITGPADIAWAEARSEEALAGRAAAERRDDDAAAHRATAAARRAEAASLARSALARYPDFPDARLRAREYEGNP